MSTSICKRRALAALQGRDAHKHAGGGLPNDAIKLAVKIEAAKRAPRFRLIGALCATLAARGVKA